MIVKKISLPVKHKKTSKRNKKEAPLCIRMEGSYLVEMAVALPFFAGFMAVLLFFFQVLTVQQEVGNALFAAGRELSVIACKEDCEPGILTAKGLMLKNLSKESSAEYFVRGGKSAISLVGSDLTGSYICLQADYQMGILFGLFGDQNIHITQKIKCRKWTGESKTEDGEDEDDIVYITLNGSVYHKSRDCTYLKPSVKSADGSRILEFRNADGGKYYACSKCMKNKKTNNITVFITEYGNRYHSKKDCSKIKRTVLTVRLSQVKDKRACSKCGKE